MDLEAINLYLKPKGYSVEVTADGSPTLRWGQGESMHHSGGAASESIYIYQTALNFLSSAELERILVKTSLQEEHLQKVTLKAEGKMNLMSLGFGVGYNELLVADWILRNSFSLEQIKLISFEKEQFLYDGCNLWLQGQSTPLGSIYDLILEKIEQHTLMDKNKVKSILREMKENHFWIQNKELNPDDKIENQFNIFLFDAFSNKTTPDLWQSHFLDQLLQVNIQLPCVFSTYACRGDLKRVLQKNNFQFIKRPGFKGKRDATLAYRI